MFFQFLYTLPEAQQKWTECERAEEIGFFLLQLEVELGGKLRCDSWERAILGVEKDGNGLDELDCEELYHRIHALCHSFERPRRGVEEETPTGKICTDIQRQIAECCPEVLTEDTEYQPVSREEYQHRITEQLENGHDPKGIYFREKVKMEERLSRYWEDSSYDDFKVRAVCHERSDFDDAFVSAVCRYAFQQETGEALENVGAIIANGGNGGRRIFPQSDLDYQFVFCDGVDAGEQNNVLSRITSDLSEIFQIRAVDVPDASLLKTNAKFRRLYEQLQRIDEKGIPFQYIVTEVKKVAQEAGLFILISQEDKCRLFLENFLGNLEAQGFSVKDVKKKSRDAAENLSGGGIDSLEKYGSDIHIVLKEIGASKASCERLYREILSFSRVDDIPNPELKEEFHEFYKWYADFTRCSDDHFEVKKLNLVKCLSASLKASVTMLRENMVARHIDGDTKAAESYFSSFQSFVSENQEAAMVVSGAQLYPIDRFLCLPCLNVKEALYRPIQSAIINTMIAQSRIHHDDLEKFFPQLKEQGMLTDKTEERLKKGLQAIDYLRISLAEYHRVSPKERGKKKDVDIFSYEFLDWIFQKKPEIGKVLAEAQTALAGIAPIYKEQHAEKREYGMITELSGGFALREGKLDFSAKKEPELQKYIFDFFEHLSRTGGEPTDSAMHFLYRAIDTECVSGNQELYHRFKHFVFDSCVRQPHFAEAARVLSRTRLLRMLFPEYANIVPKRSLGRYYLQGDEMLANLLYLREDVAENSECREIWKDVEITGAVKVLHLAILFRNSADIEAAFDEIDPEKSIITQTEREEIVFLIKHQGCLFPPNSKEKRETAMNGGNGHHQLDIASSGERVNPFEHERFAEIIKEKKHLANALIALNVSRKIALNPVRPDKQRLLSAATHFHQEHRYRTYLENSIKYNADFFWKLVESVLSDSEESARKKYIKGLKKSPGIIVSRMINALIAKKRYPSGKNDIGKLADIIPLLDAEKLAAESKALEQKGKDNVSYSVVREDPEQKTATVSFCIPRTSESLQNMGIAFSNNECSIEQATTLPIDDENMIITAHIRYTGKADGSQIQTGIDTFVHSDSQGIEKTKESASFPEDPEITINKDENAIEIITFGEVIPAYTFADIMGVFAKAKITPDHFMLTTKEKMKYTEGRNPTVAPAGIHDKFFFPPGTQIPDSIKRDLENTLKPSSHHNGIPL